MREMKFIPWIVASRPARLNRSQLLLTHLKSRKHFGQRCVQEHLRLRPSLTAREQAFVTTLKYIHL